MTRIFMTPVLCCVCNSHIMDVDSAFVTHPLNPAHFAITPGCMGFGSWSLPAVISLDFYCPVCGMFPFHCSMDDGSISPLLTVGRWSEGRQMYEPELLHITRIPAGPFEELDPEQHDSEDDNGSQGRAEEGTSEESGTVPQEVSPDSDPGCAECPEDQTITGDPSSRRKGEPHAVERAELQEAQQGNGQREERAGGQGGQRGPRGHRR